MKLRNSEVVSENGKESEGEESGCATPKLNHFGNKSNGNERNVNGNHENCERKNESTLLELEKSEDRIAKRIYIGECAGNRSVGRLRKR